MYLNKAEIINRVGLEAPHLCKVYVLLYVQKSKWGIINNTLTVVILALLICFINS